MDGAPTDDFILGESVVEARHETGFCFVSGEVMPGDAMGRVLVHDDRDPWRISSLLPRRIRTCRRRVPVFCRDDHIVVWLHDDVWRHDLHASFEVALAALG